MDSILRQILIQAACYGGVILLSIFSIALLMRGFFWKYIKARTSFGKYILIKIRTISRDYFKLGWIENGQLKFKDVEQLDNKKRKYIAVLDIDSDKKSPIYRCLGVQWIDITEDKKSIVYPSGQEISGYDAKKHSDLMVRCLQEPRIKTDEDWVKYMVLGIGILTLLILYMCYRNATAIAEIKTILPTVCKGVITSTTGVV